MRTTPLSRRSLSGVERKICSPVSENGSNTNAATHNDGTLSICPALASLLIDVDPLILAGCANDERSRPVGLPKPAHAAAHVREISGAPRSDLDGQ